MKEFLIWRIKNGGVGYRKTEYPEPEGDYSYPEASKTPSYSSQSMEWWMKNEVPQLEKEGYLITPLQTI